MQTVLTQIRRRVLRRLIWVYTVYQCPFYGTLGINELIFLLFYLSEKMFFTFYSSYLLRLTEMSSLLCEIQKTKIHHLSSANSVSKMLKANRTLKIDLSSGMKIYANFTILYPFHIKKYLSCNAKKPSFAYMHPAKIQISLRIRAV